MLPITFNFKDALSKVLCGTLELESSIVFAKSCILLPILSTKPILPFLLIFPHMETEF